MSLSFVNEKHDQGAGLPRGILTMGDGREAFVKLSEFENTSKHFPKISFTSTQYRIK
jgi:polyisoprenoid-binding protein YceI